MWRQRSEGRTRKGKQNKNKLANHPGEPRKKLSSTVHPFKTRPAKAAVRQQLSSEHMLLPRVIIAVRWRNQKFLPFLSFQELSGLISISRFHDFNRVPSRHFDVSRGLLYQILDGFTQRCATRGEGSAEAGAYVRGQRIRLQWYVRSRWWKLVEGAAPGLRQVDNESRQIKWGACGRQPGAPHCVKHCLIRCSFLVGESLLKQWYVAEQDWLRGGEGGG